MPIIKNILITLILFITIPLYAEIKTQSVKINGYQKLAAKGELIIKFKPGTPSSQKTGMMTKHNIRQKDIIRELGFEKIEIPDNETMESFINKLKSLPEIESVEPNYIRKAFSTTPNDPFYEPRQWGLPQVYLPFAWDITTGTKNVLVAVVDTGIDYNHPDLYANIYSSGMNFSVNPPTPDGMDDNTGEYHGTHVAGIIAAVGNNSLGVCGASWNTKLLPVKVLDSDGNGDDFSIAKGIAYAADTGANIINMSFGDTSYPPWYSTVLSTSCAYANNKGSILVAASGNGLSNGTATRYDAVAYPAAFPYVIAVGASNQSDTKAYFSCYGPELCLIAPGVDIYSTIKSSYAYMSGTSMATPLVCGILSLIVSIKPDITPAYAKDIISITADDIGATGFDNETGYGRINAYRAVTYLKGVPKNLVRSVNYPNPVKSGKITYLRVPDSMIGTTMKVKIFNLAGDLVRVLDTRSETTSTSAMWNGRNDYNELVAEGLYFYVIETDKGKAKGKITLIK